MIGSASVSGSVIVICPKCLTIETDGSLRCRKCGAQLYTGVFQKPVLPEPASQQAAEADSRGRGRGRTHAIALAVFLVAAAVLVIVLSQLELHLR